MRTTVLAFAALAMALGIAPVSAADTDPALLTKATALMEKDFQSRGIAKVERLKQDDVMSLCTQYRGALPADVAKRVQAEQMATIKFPADGKYMGDWKNGDKIAQSGRGATWSDKPDTVNGGGCYNCHRVSGTELSYGTIGPSLYQFGKLRGGPTEANMKYVYGKLYNSQAYVPCSNMPRFGYHGVLTEAQIKDLVALLLDPESIVNQ
ncbi:MAG: sulfur oxidation c-type cytochrome SoxX [Burkholderiales bacterium]|nr:sulfur oxidation c-type cytochrome SoxX [Burkholderiales bacterium]PZN02545.1 MAG: sulfur oxidation c-type cytochrome SoxX [Pseudomonadota bacterium]